MKVENLSSLTESTEFDADVIIIGGGAAGITLAREFSKTHVRVILLESGGHAETEITSELNAVESVGDPSSPAQIAKRKEFHKASATLWSHEIQPYGVRCRGLGGSTQAWAGKSAPFDEIDFEKRDWIEHSNWPIALSSLNPFIARAAELLNLGPVINDERFWTLLGVARKIPLDDKIVRSYFWQFARSRLNPIDIMRFGREFDLEYMPNVHVLIHATVTQIFTNAAGNAFKSLAVTALSGTRHTVRGRYAVLAAGAIENARLLLASNTQFAEGLGNRFDMVGRFLMDHLGCRIARIENPKDIGAVHNHFGFYALRHRNNTHMYAHGLAVQPAIQGREGLANSALYVMELRAPDDPWLPLKRLIKRESQFPLRDMLTITRNSKFLVNGLGRKIIQHRRTPAIVKKIIVDLTIRLNPQFVATEFQFGGLPHKLTALAIDAITEQRPDPENRVTLSARTDRFGYPLAKIHWRIGSQSRRDLARTAQFLSDEFRRAALPKPLLEDWVKTGQFEDAVIIDMAHTAGTTRMSEDPAAGVVNVDSKLHGIDGIYVAGASVFPTSGHANPTLMICAMTIRLADHLKVLISQSGLAAVARAEPDPLEISTSPRVLVTGATGNIGRILVDHLIAAGFRVRGQYARAPGTDTRLEWRRANFIDDLEMDHLVEGCDAVIHLAGELNDMPVMERVNVEATRALAETAQGQGVRYFGYASSMVVYGSPLKRTLTENSPVIDPSTSIISQYYADPEMREYARTKMLGELAVRSIATNVLKTTMSVDIYRISVVADLKRLQEAFGWSRRRKLFSLYRRTQYVYDHDVAAALVHLLTRGLERQSPSIEVYNIADRSSGTYANVMKIARSRGTNNAFSSTLNVPVLLDLAKAAIKYKAVPLRYPIGMIKLRADKLEASGFITPIGFEKAITLAADAYRKNHEAIKS